MEVWWSGAWASEISISGLVSLSKRLSTSVDKIWIGPDLTGSYHRPDNGLDHGSDHRSDLGSDGSDQDLKFKILLSKLH